MCTNLCEYIFQQTNRDPYEFKCPSVCKHNITRNKNTDMNNDKRKIKSNLMVKRIKLFDTRIKDKNRWLFYTVNQTHKPKWDDVDMRFLYKNYKVLCKLL